MSQVKLIVSNWKMNLNISQARTLTNKLKKIKINTNLIKNIICPQFILLPIISNIVKGSNILLGAQDCHHKKFGAYTGDTSIELIKEIGCKYIIIGHSERREYKGETNDIVREKAELVISEKLKNQLNVRILLISSNFKLDPPIKAPFTSESLNISCIFFESTEPP